jgi:predicted nucleic-acid-binding Zn-ribbon protein
MYKMMMNKQECKYVEYIVNLLTVEGNGSFSCPKCGMTISPEDETEKNYTIKNTKVIDDELVELVIACGKCGITIVLTGFQYLV